MSGMSLFALASQYQGLMALAASDEDIDPQALADTTEALTGEIAIKGQNVARVIANIEAHAQAIREASKAMAARAARLDRRTEWLRAYLLTNLQAAGITELDSPELVVKVRKNPPSVAVLDASVVPDLYMTHPEPPPPQPNKKAIKEAIVAGVAVPGCELKQSERLEIRP
jgi:hypothetical protein